MSPIYSRFAADEDWRELIESLVEDIPLRIAALDKALQANDLMEIVHLVHQLKGACGSYGFDDVTSLARSVEAALDNEPSLAKAQAELAALRDALGRLTAMVPPGEPSLAR